MRRPDPPAPYVPAPPSPRPSRRVARAQEGRNGEPNACSLVANGYLPPDDRQFGGICTQSERVIEARSCSLPVSAEEDACWWSAAGGDGVCGGRVKVGGVEVCGVEVWAGDLDVVWWGG